MVQITCIIPTSGSARSISNLKRCIKSLTSSVSFTKKIKLNIYLITSNMNIRTQLRGISVVMYHFVSEESGFAQMNNIAIEESVKLHFSDYYLLINDDAWVKPDFFEKFNEGISRFSGDIYCPLIFNTTGSIQSFGIEYFPSGYAINNTFMNTKSVIVPGACVLINTKLLKKLKKKYGFYFNPLLYSYYEDIELSIRAHAIGAKIIKLPELNAFHIGSNSYGPYSKTVMFQSYRNILWVMWMTWPTKVILSNFVYILIVQLWFIFCSIRDNHLFIYPAIAVQTVQNYKELRRLRRTILNQYKKEFNINVLFSQHWFRLRKSGVGLKRLNIFLVTK